MTTPAASTENTRDTVRSLFTMLQSGDLEGLKAILAPHATWWLNGELPTSKKWVGPDEIVAVFLPKMFARFDDRLPVKQTVHHIIADGQLAVAEWASSATTLAGAAYYNDYVAVFRVESGLIVEVREYMDTGYAQRVMFG